MAGLPPVANVKSQFVNMTKRKIATANGSVNVNVSPTETGARNMKKKVELQSIITAVDMMPNMMEATATDLPIAIMARSETRIT